jgi:Ca2+-binding RTX toxin-like protein
LLGLALAGAGLAAVGVAITGVVAQAAEEEDVPRCHGRQAKIVGTDGDDVLHGTSSRDVIWGGKGDDRIYGSLGNDLICGGPGADLVHGGRGNDEVDGGAGDRDRAIGDLGDDKVLGGAGDHDEAAGSLGIDIVNGGPGDYDLVRGDYGWDRMSGGAGRHDIASFAGNVAGGKGAGVWVSLKAHKARGDGHDKLFKFEDIEGSAFGDTLIGDKGGNVIRGGLGDDRIFGAGGRDTIDGQQGTDGCKGAKGRTVSCGREPAPKASAYVQLNPLARGGAGLQVVGGAGPDHFEVGFDEVAEVFHVSARKGLAIGAGCSRPPGVFNQVSCPAGGPGSWLMADLGPGNDSLRVKGSLKAVGTVRLAGGDGNDVIHGGPEDDLIESGRGADKLYGHAGADGLVGGLPGPTFLYGGANGDLMAAGGGCAGGAIVGGSGRDDASFAETQGHPGLLIVSFPRHAAWIDVVKDCDPVRLSPTNEDMEGSFADDVLIGDSGRNAMLGQPGRDRFYGNGGDDVIDARDGVRDLSIQCGRGRPARKKRNGKGFTKPTGKPAGRTLTDHFDPSPFRCTHHKLGTPVPGLHG